MTILLLGWLIGSCLLTGYVLGAVHQIKIERRRRAIKTQRVPLLLRQSKPEPTPWIIPAGRISGIQYGPELPDLSKWSRRPHR